MQCSIVQCSAVQCSAVQYSAVQCHAMQFSAVQDYVNPTDVLVPVVAVGLSNVKLLIEDDLRLLVNIKTTILSFLYSKTKPNRLVVSDVFKNHILATCV